VAKTTENKPVSLAGLGLCEHCGILVTSENMPGDSMDAVWKCPKCEKVLSEKSFGFENGKRKFWVGADKKWTEQKPTEDFNLGTWLVLIRPIY
jgi:hypothetical protein